MDTEKTKKPVQMMLNSDEFGVVRAVAFKRHFSSLNKYLRSLVERDVIEMKKKLGNHAWTLGMNPMKWEKLNEEQKEEYMNQIGTNVSESLEQTMDRIRNGPSPGELINMNRNNPKYREEDLRL